MSRFRWPSKNEIDPKLAENARKDADQRRQTQQRRLWWLLLGLCGLGCLVMLFPVRQEEVLSIEEMMERPSAVDRLAETIGQIFKTVNKVRISVTRQGLQVLKFYRIDPEVWEKKWKNKTYQVNAVTGSVIVTYEADGNHPVETLGPPILSGYLCVKEFDVSGKPNRLKCRFFA